LIEAEARIEVRGSAVRQGEHRFPTFGVRAATSEDEGLTWGDEPIVRDDGAGRTWRAGRWREAAHRAEILRWIEGLRKGRDSLRAPARCR
jgi:hypothetical protein